jgi:hypothetical protein
MNCARSLVERNLTPTDVSRNDYAIIKHPATIARRGGWGGTWGACSPNVEEPQNALKLPICLDTWLSRLVGSNLGEYRRSGTDPLDRVKSYGMIADLHVSTEISISRDFWTHSPFW